MRIIALNYQLITHLKENINMTKNIILTAMLLCSNIVFANEYSKGSAPCTIGDGYQTVNFNNNSSYSGYFKSCRPLAGQAKFVQGSDVITGYATPINDKTVELSSGNQTVTITLQIQRR